MRPAPRQVVSRFWKHRKKTRNSRASHSRTLPACLPVYPVLSFECSNSVVIPRAACLQLATWQCAAAAHVTGGRSSVFDSPPPTHPPSCPSVCLRRACAPSRLSVAAAHWPAPGFRLRKTIRKKPLASTMCPVMLCLTLTAVMLSPAGARHVSSTAGTGCAFLPTVDRVSERRDVCRVECCRAE